MRTQLDDNPATQAEIRIGGGEEGRLQKNQARARRAGEVICSEDGSGRQTAQSRRPPDRKAHYFTNDLATSGCGKHGRERGLLAPRRSDVTRRYRRRAQFHFYMVLGKHGVLRAIGLSAGTLFCEEGDGIRAEVARQFPSDSSN